MSSSDSLLQYRLPLNWLMSFPENWSYEFIQEEGQAMFYPEDSDLTFRITPWQIGNETELAPVEVMLDSFTNSIPKDMEKLQFNKELLEPFVTEGFFGTTTENGEKVYRISFGIVVTGNLLVINIYGTNETEVNNSIKYIYTVGKL